MAESAPWRDYVRHAAALLNLPMNEAREVAVSEHFARLAEPAAALLAFAPAEHEEPAGVYRPDPEQP